MDSTSTLPLPTLRWGVIGTGLISSWFVEDLILPREDARARHIIQAIGSSSVAKGNAFRATQLPNSSPTIYGSYLELFQDSDVDIVYIGTPHAFHKQNCLDAIAAGKHVLCEKAFTITSNEAEAVLAAAKAKGVFVMEALWTRFTPLVLSLQKKLFDEKIIGDVRRTFCDFGLDMDVSSLGPESRLKNPELGAGSLLDIGIYSLTWGLLTLSPEMGEKAERPNVLATQSLSDHIDIASSIVLHYPTTGRQGLLTSTMEFKTHRNFCRIEGTEGHIIVEGLGASLPASFTIFPKMKAAANGVASTQDGQLHMFDKPGKGFYYEADAVAIDISEGRLENAIMPHAETMRVMKMMDQIRRQGGAKFPQDDQ